MNLEQGKDQNRLLEPGHQTLDMSEPLRNHEVQVPIHQVRININTYGFILGNAESSKQSNSI